LLGFRGAFRLNATVPDHDYVELQGETLIQLGEETGEPAGRRGVVRHLQRHCCIGGDRLQAARLLP
jgi:hypothetical protein